MPEAPRADDPFNDVEPQTVDDLIDDDAPVDPDVDPALIPSKPIEEMTGPEMRRWFVELKSLRAKREGSLDAVKAKLAELERAIVDDFINTGERSARLADGRLVHLKQRTTASKRPDVSVEDFHLALADADLDTLIKPKVEASSLAAAVRELTADGKELPAGLDAVLNVNRIVTLGVRKS